MTNIPAPNASFIPPTLGCTPEWRFPYYDAAFRRVTARDGEMPAPLLDNPRLNRALRPLLPAAYIEWRYYSIISPAFHGILGVALVNPYNRVPFIAEDGMLVILAGMIDAPRNAEDLAQAVAQDDHRQICYMHRFPSTTCEFEDTQFYAEHAGATITMQQPTTQHAEIHLTHVDGLDLSLTHTGQAGFEIPPCYADDLRRVPGAHWTVYCPAPVATTSGSLQASQNFLRGLRHQPDPNRANLVTDNLLNNGDVHLTWDDADGYYEHSFGINPMPLHGWDFLFAPDARQKCGIVMQTYPRSDTLRYVETLWWGEDRPHYVRFSADQMHLAWAEQYRDPDIGVALPKRRRVVAEGHGLKLEIDNAVTHQIAFLRAEKLAVRHFFISEQIGFCDWRLSTSAGEVLAEVNGHPCGGELAHFRARTPQRR